MNSVNDSRVSDTIIFEGAGWSNADTSKKTDMLNCRVRTTFINDDGKKIYLELGYFDNSDNKSLSKWHKGFSHPWHINFLFYCDSRIKGKNHNWESLGDLVYTVREYTKKDVLHFLKYALKANFKNLQTLNNSDYCGFSHTGLPKDDFHKNTNQDLSEGEIK